MLDQFKYKTDKSKVVDGIARDSFLTEAELGEAGVSHGDLSREIDERRNPMSFEIVHSDGPKNRYIFRKSRLEKHREKVIGLIRKIVRDPFFADTEGGWSLLELTEDREGLAWADLSTAEQFACICCCLGVAVWLYIPRNYIRFEPLDKIDDDTTIIQPD